MELRLLIKNNTISNKLQYDPYLMDLWGVYAVDVVSVNFSEGQTLTIKKEAHTCIRQGTVAIVLLLKCELKLIVKFFCPIKVDAKKNDNNK